MDPYQYALREPCDASPEDCCPLGTHETQEVLPDFKDPAISWVYIVCVRDEVPCADAGLDADACQDAGADAP